MRIKFVGYLPSLSRDYEDGGRLEAGSQGQASTETNNVALNPFVIETIWDGFIIQNGRTRIRHGKDGGAGVALRKNGRLENCIIRNNYNVASRSRGGGAFCNNGIIFQLFRFQ